MRRIGRLDLRQREAARLGYRRILVPEGAPTAAGVGSRAVPVADVGAAVEWLRASAREAVNIR